MIVHPLEHSVSICWLTELTQGCRCYSRHLSPSNKVRGEKATMNVCLLNADIIDYD